jgi:hypothetical protein
LHDSSDLPGFGFISEVDNLLERDGTRSTDEIELSRETSHVIKVIHTTPRWRETMKALSVKHPLVKRLMRMLVPEQRVANRHGMPPVVAYLGMTRASKEYKIGDISVAGFYMVTEERWVQGSAFPVTLERTDEGAHGQMLTVFSTVVRNGVDGVGFTFMKPAEEDKRAAEARNSSAARLELIKLVRFLNGLPLSEPSSDAFERAW